MWRPPLTRPEAYGFQSGYAPVGDVRLHYARTGNGPPLILLHGWPEFWLTWRRLMPLLADRFDLIAPDLRGFGASDKPTFGPSRTQTADVMARDILGLMDALGIRRAGLVGHDVGAMVMQAAALQAPNRISGLFFFNCPYPGIGQRWYAPEQVKEVWYQNFQQLPWAARMVGESRQSCALYFRHFLTHWAGRIDAFDEDFEAWVDNFMQPGNIQGGFNWYLSVAATRLAIARGELPPQPPIDLPTGVLWGRLDPVLRVEWADRMPEFFPRVEMAVCESAGHFVHYEAPQEAAAAVGALFERVS
ncbi:MAG: alpha/beta hydrolase [Alphaproteobacteria bacterium]|nr:alpha/beta hydrolase [Alphaproteobacteria bacterium]MCB9929640.1 alpha/beta hydrolase [Alphaproteobacteria bacterium]